MAVREGSFPTTQIRLHDACCLLELLKKCENMQYHSEANGVERDSGNRKEDETKEEELP